MPKVTEISAKAVNDFANGRGQYRGEMLCVSKGLYLRRRLANDQKYKCHWVFRSQVPAFKMMFGSYPTMTLAQARAKVHEIQTQLQAGIDPRAEKKAEIEARRKEQEATEIEQRTFSKVAKLWLESERKGKKWKNDPTGEQHAETNLRLHILPVLGIVLLKILDGRTSTTFMITKTCISLIKKLLENVGRLLMPCALLHSMKDGQRMPSRQL